MDEVLRAALAPVLRDLSRDGLREPRFEEHDWTDDTDRPAAIMWSPDGSGRGIAVSRSGPAFERIAEAADHVQEWVIEELWGHAPTNWPRCPEHPDNHPLEATAVNATAVWLCPKDQVVVAPIGSL